MKQFRCENCNKRLFDYEHAKIEIKCPRCGTINKLDNEEDFETNFVTN